MIMNKQEEFFIIVQCGILVHVKDLPQVSALNIAMDLIAKAIGVAPRLPAELSASEAAVQFIEYIGLDQVLGEKKPDWLK